jgi:hypothetical protein
VAPEQFGTLGSKEKISWFENDGSEGFTEHTVTQKVFDPESVHVTDIEGDGDIDIFSASALDHKIAWYENTAGVLPVEMAGITARLSGQETILSWRTFSETNNAGFRIQRRVGARERGGKGDGERGGGKAWTTVGKVDGAGTTSQPQSYRYTDGDLPYEAERLTYRLKQVDTDGTASFTETVTVERGVTEVQLLAPYPNPVRGQATVRYALPGKQETTIRLYDLLGRQVRTVVSEKEEGRHEQTLDVSGLSSGVYFLRLRAGGDVRTQKMTVVQ